LYKRILLAYDGSKEGRTALREGALMARRCRSQVFLLSVIAEDAGTRFADGAGGVGEIQQQDRYHALLQDGVARLQRLGFEPKFRLVLGEPAQVVGACAEEFDADLVVVGHHRQSVFWRWWSGSSGGAYVSDHVHCSVLVCRNVLSDEVFAAELANSSSATITPGAPSNGRRQTGGAAPPTPEVAAAPAAKPVPATTASTAAAPPPSGEPVQLPTAAPSATSASTRRRWTRRGLFVVLPLVLIIASYVYITGGQVVSLENAYVAADKLGISTDVSGTVASIEVTENQPVTAGQVLFRFDELPFRLALNRARAQVGMVRDALNALKANHRDAQVQIQQGQDDLAYFSAEFGRQKDLFAVHVASQAGYDIARRNLQNAQQKLASLKQQLAAIAANLNGHPDGPVERKPRYLEAVAQQDEADRQLAHSVVRAPFAGIVTNVPAIALGQYLPTSTTAFYLVATDHVWVEANPKETELTFVRPGQPVTVSVDTYPDAQWRGTVHSIRPAAAQAFSLLPAQNTSGNWVKVVQRIPLRVRLDNGGKDLPVLRDGMSVVVDIDTGHARGWPHFLSGWFDHARKAP